MNAADLIVVMDADQERKVRSVYRRGPEDVLVLADLLPAFRDARLIPDPVDQPMEAFERVYGQIDECLAVLRSVLNPR